MKSTIFYIDLLQGNVPEARNDNQLAIYLGIKRQTISQYRRGQSMSIYVAVKIADLLGVNPMELIAVTMHEQCQNEPEKAFWQQQYTKAGGS